MSTHENAQSVTTPQTDPFPAISKVAGWLLRGGVLLCLLLSLYLLFFSLTNSPTGPPGCGQAGVLDCSHVLNSRWAQWWGLPVTLPAIPFYLALLFASVFLGPKIPPVVRRRAFGLCLAAALALGLLALWFMTLQLVVLRHICLFCSAAHVVHLLIAGVMLRANRLTWRSTAHSGLVSVGLLLFVMAGQVLVDEPQQFIVASPQRHFDDEVFHVSSKADMEFGSSAGARWLVGGLVGIDAQELPLIGDPRARHTAALMFDYACPNCRRMHRQLRASQPMREGRLAIVLIPVPLHPDCNHYIQADVIPLEDACPLAQLALAVWQASPQQFAEFDAWLTETEAPPSAAAARQQAAALLGAEALQQALDSPRITEQLQRNTRLYDFLERGILPKLLLHDNYIMGRMRSVEELETVLPK